MQRALDWLKNCVNSAKFTQLAEPNVDKDSEILWVNRARILNLNERSFFDAVKRPALEMNRVRKRASMKVVSALFFHMSITPIVRRAC